MSVTLTFLLAFILLLQFIQSLKILTNDHRNSDNRAVVTGEEILQALFQPRNYIIQYKNRRALSQRDVAKAKELFKKLKQQMGSSEMKFFLRQNETNPITPENEDTGKKEIPDIEQEKLTEKELRSTLVQKTSELYSRPYVEQQGLKDYLVMRPGSLDPFVTAIPNSIYYDIEKKCVNWLDDCSLRGIRARLLRGARYP